MSETSQDPVIRGTELEHESQRQMLAREAVQRGRLPGQPADRTWGGAGSGEACSVCSLVITAQDIGYELEFAQNGQGRICCYLHIHCFEAWERAFRSGNTAGIVELHDEESSRHPKLDGHQRDPGQ